MKLLRDLTLGLYLPGNSPVHELDPRAKLGACALAMGTVFAPGPWWGTAWAWLLLAVGMTVSRVPLGVFIRGFRPFFWLFAFTLLLHGLTTPGTPLLSLSFQQVSFTREGLLQGVAVSVQLATAVGFSSLLSLTTSPTDLVWALERLASPLARIGVPVGEFCVTALVAIRFFPILHEEAERLTLALRARGLDPSEGGILHRWRNTVPLVVPLFRQVLQRADTLALALDLRGYRPGQVRTSWRARGLGGPEWATLALASAGLGVVVAVELIGRLS